VPLQQELSWGYHIPYMVTGTHNQHPRAAMAIMGTEKERDYCAFYDLIAAEEERD